MYQQEISHLRQHYTSLLDIHGDTPQGVHWTGRTFQERRFKILSEVGELTNTKILDFGCGTGHLLEWLRQDLRFTGEYIGYDITPRMIALAKSKFPGIQFEQREILEEGVDFEFDYVLISGVFNNRVSDNWGLMAAILIKLFSYTRRALAFNALSTLTENQDPELYYVNSTKVYRFCSSALSPYVTLRNDYLLDPQIGPHEFTIYVYRRENNPW